MSSICCGVVLEADVGKQLKDIMFHTFNSAPQSVDPTHCHILHHTAMLRHAVYRRFTGHMTAFLLCDVFLS